jgi:integrase
MRTLQRLNALSVTSAKVPGYFHDGGGLYLQVARAGSKSWVLRFSIAGRRREMGLGPCPEVSLAVARRLAAEARSLVKAGQDPIAARDAGRARQRLDEARGITFDKAAELYIAANEAGWRSDRHRNQWRASLATFASPVIGRMPVADIGVPEVMRVVEPLWRTKTETGSRVRGRIERVLDWAKVRGYRTDENPARWRGHLDKLLPARRKAQRVQHHPAIAIDDLPAVYAKLADLDSMAARALRFVILTAARAGEVTGARWSEIDMDARVWTVPSDRIKAGKTHRVPLSREAMEILARVRKVATGNLVFPGWVTERPLSHSAMLKVLKVAGCGDATVHGFRSTFRDWASERTHYPRDVAEMALAHAIGDQVEAAYRRGDLFERRKLMMEEWATFVTATPSAKLPADRQRVVSINERRRADLA